MISLLVAMDKNRVIGKDNQLPWHLPEDLKYFKRITMGHKIIMGRKTFESIGRPLPGRDNFVVTRDQSYKAEGCHILHSVDDIFEIDKSSSGDELFIIGGAELFRHVLPNANRLYITHIDAEFAGDTFFPEINEEQWKLLSKKKGITNDKNPYDYWFAVYGRQ